MKKVLFLWVVISSAAQAQNDLIFDKRFVESEDCWVAFPPKKDSTFPFGFIYIDPFAGLTLQFEGVFRIAPDGKYISQKNDSASYKVRLKPNKQLVALIPASRFAELSIESTPQWLKYYKTDTGSVKRLYDWGFRYNGWNECAKALTYLERAQTIDPKYKGLAVELAYSYNCLQQYEKAITVLKSALKENPADAYINKEFIYAQAKSGKLDNASESCLKALEVCTDTSYNGEMCYNLLHAYYEKKDKTNFHKWLPVTKKWVASISALTESLKIMEEEIAR